jgi:uncharacterized protein with HEPN domain
MRREELYLADLVDNARAVHGYLDGVTRERWDSDDMLRDAVLYRMLLLGEIASVLPDDLRDRSPDVAWRQIRAFRNLAVHQYFGVDWAVVWKAGAGDHPRGVPRTGQDLRARIRTRAESWDCALTNAGGDASRTPSKVASRLGGGQYLARL